MNGQASPGFERVARIYPWLERLSYGRLLQRGRLDCLPTLAHCRQILLLGEGNGRFLRALLTQNQHCQATVIETSPRMIQLAQQRLAPEQCRQVTWIQQSALDVTLPAAYYDAIITHYFFDLFPPSDQHQMIQAGVRALADGGCWQDTEFLDGGTTWYSRIRNRILHTVHYRFFGSLCDFPARHLHNPLSFFEQAGLRLLREQTFHDHFSARLWRKEPTSTDQDALGIHRCGKTAV